jgi:hypothetical protein
MVLFSSSANAAVMFVWAVLGLGLGTFDFVNNPGSRIISGNIFKVCKHIAAVWFTQSKRMRLFILTYKKYFTNSCRLDFSNGVT